MFKLQLTKKRIILWLLAAAYGVFQSYLVFSVSGHDVKSNYTDYKNIQKYFNHKFEEIGEISWRLVEQDCHKYHLKKHKSVLILDYMEKYGTIFSDKISPTTRFMTSTFERYTQFASEGLSPTVDEAFIPEALMKEIYEIYQGTEIITEWKNVSIDKKCYHLLDKISEIPGKNNKEYIQRILKEHQDQSHE